MKGKRKEVKNKGDKSIRGKIMSKSATSRKDIFPPPLSVRCLLWGGGKNIIFWGNIYPY